MPSDIDPRLVDAATASVYAEISRTDTKASVLLTAFSLPLAALVAALPGKDLPALPATLVGTGTVALVVAMLIVLSVVRPRLGGEARGSFLHWSRCTTTAELQAALATPTGSEDHLMTLSRIARRKYIGLRLAGDVTAAALTALAAALLTSV
ncbi:Pycsar system effector family protein [Streptomyces anulatus]